MCICEPVCVMYVCLCVYMCEPVSVCVHVYACVCAVWSSPSDPLALVLDFRVICAKHAGHHGLHCRPPA